MTWIYFTKKSIEECVMERIKKRFGISEFKNVNGEYYCEVKDEDWSDLKKTQGLGYIQIRKSNDNKRFTHRPEN